MILNDLSGGVAGYGISVRYDLHGTGKSWLVTVAIIVAQYFADRFQRIFEKSNTRHVHEILSTVVAFDTTLRRQGKC